MNNVISSQAFSDLEKAAQKEKAARAGKQKPRKTAPKLDPQDVIKYNGLHFKLYEQTDRSLVLVVDESQPNNTGIETKRLVSYIAHTTKKFPAKGWWWRPTKAKKLKLTLKADCPQDELLA